MMISDDFLFREQIFLEVGIQRKAGQNIATMRFLLSFGLEMLHEWGHREDIEARCAM
jgi:hypothetical protein